MLEFIPRAPASGPAALESMLMQGIRKFYHIFPGQYRLLGLGMHPTLTLDRTAVWDHDEGEYYEGYDRLFNIHQHGWLNIQALQINLSYAGEKDLLMQYNRIRTLLPYLIALTASSPMVEGHLTGKMDNRLIYYRENQKEIPAICNGIIPARQSVAEYRNAQEQIFSDFRARDAEILCEEWLNSSGLIIRFSRECLEIKAPDEQECIRSDMAVASLVTALLRCPTLPVETDQDALLALTETAIEKGTAGLRPELEALYRSAWQKATAEERQYLPVIESRIAKRQPCRADDGAVPSGECDRADPCRHGALPADERAVRDEVIFFGYAEDDIHRTGFALEPWKPVTENFGRAQLASGLSGARQGKDSLILLLKSLIRRGGAPPGAAAFIVFDGEVTSSS